MCGAADALPFDEEPEVFGLHSNARISLRLSEADYVVQSLITMQPRTGASASSSSSAVTSNDDQVLNVIDSVLKAVPAPLRRSDAGYGTFTPVPPLHTTHSLGTVLLQEMDKFNVLLETVSATANELRNAIKGIVVMSQELDDMYTAILNNKVCNWRVACSVSCCGWSVVGV